MSPRGPSGASKSLFKNLKKPSVFTRFWVQRPPKRASRNPRAAREAPKELQRPMQKTAQKITKNACLVKNALSRRSHFLPFLGPEECQENLKVKTCKKDKSVIHQKSCSIMGGVVKNALSRRSHFDPWMDPLFGDISCSFLSSSFT